MGQVRHGSPRTAHAVRAAIQRSQPESISVTDKIWAIAYANCGAIKRLRPRADGSVELLSNNPNVPNSLAYDGEVHLLGRVVAVVRKL